MNLPVYGELQLVGGSSHLFYDGEGTDAFIVELLLWSREVEVGGIQPDLITDLIIARRRFLFVILALHATCGLLKCFASFSMNVTHRHNEVRRGGIRDGIVGFGVGNESGGYGRREP